MKLQVAILAAAAAGCSVFGDFSGYSSGGAPPASGDAGALADAPSEQPAPSDAGSSDSDSGSSAVFVDLFDRPDGVVGNDWLEKTPGAFKIVAGEVVVSGGAYQDHLLYRPMAEDVRDVEISTEFVFTAASSDCLCDPTLIARLQHAVIPTRGKLHAYMAYVDGGADLALGRYDSTAGGVTVLRGVPLSTAVTKGRYRLTFRVKGTSPVLLTASVERRDGTAWTRLAEVTHSDTSEKRIEAPGSVALSSDDETPFRYDVFTRTSLE